MNVLIGRYWHYKIKLMAVLENGGGKIKTVWFFNQGNREGTPFFVSLVCPTYQQWKLYLFFRARFSYSRLSQMFYNNAFSKKN